MKSSFYYRALTVFSILFLGQFFSIPYAFAQSVTVTVEDKALLDFDQIDVQVLLMETKFDFEQKEYTNLEMPELLDADKLKAELGKLKLVHKLIDSNSMPKSFYRTETKKQQIQTTTTSTYHVVLSNENQLNQFKKLVGSWPNLKIKTADFRAKNEDASLEKLTHQLLEEAKLKADKFAKAIGKTTTDPINIKVINMQTEGYPNVAVLYVLEQNAYMKLEVTFETN